MIKAYELNERGKIELTPEELQKLLEEAENEGRRLAGQPSIISYPSCPIQTIPVVRRVEIGDTPPFVSPVTCQTAQDRSKETA